MKAVTGSSLYIAPPYIEPGSSKVSFGCAKLDAVTFKGNGSKPKLELPPEYSSIDDIKPLGGIFKQISESPDDSIPTEIRDEATQLKNTLAAKVITTAITSYFPFRNLEKAFKNVINLPIANGSSTTLQDWIITTTDKLIDAANQNASGSITCNEFSKKATMSKSFSETQAGQVLSLVLPLQGYTVEIFPAPAFAG